MITTNLQDLYLSNLAKAATPVSVYLINGIKLSGLISSFDQDVVILHDYKSTMDQLLYKHAISTIVPAKKNNIAVNANNLEPEGTFE